VGQFWIKVVDTDSEILSSIGVALRWLVSCGGDGWRCKGGYAVVGGFHLMVL
jgi:hypothetical protein